MELGDIREADYLLKSPQQFQQEAQQQAQMQQQMMQMQLMAEKAKNEFETKGKLIESQKDFVEDIALNEQEFRHDMALEAIKNDAADEKAA